MAAILNLLHACKIGERAFPEWQATDTIMDLGCRTIPGKGKHTCHHLSPKSHVSYFHFPIGDFFPHCCFPVAGFDSPGPILAGSSKDPLVRGLNKALMLYWEMM